MPQNEVLVLLPLLPGEELVGVYLAVEADLCVRVAAVHDRVEDCVRLDLVLHLLRVMHR
jgi:hypothetical protein